ncbi:uncharacterized protein METZ01_LOCUS234200, partial [marine metagenome]
HIDKEHRIPDQTEGKKEEEGRG